MSVLVSEMRSLSLENSRNNNGKRIEMKITSRSVCEVNINDEISNANRSIDIELFCMRYFLNEVYLWRMCRCDQNRMIDELIFSSVEARRCIWIRNVPSRWGRRTRNSYDCCKKMSSKLRTVVDEKGRKTSQRSSLSQKPGICYCCFSNPNICSNLISYQMSFCWKAISSSQQMSLMRDQSSVKRKCAKLYFWFSLTRSNRRKTTQNRSKCHFLKKNVIKWVFEFCFLECVQLEWHSQGRWQKKKKKECFFLSIWNRNK